VHIITVKTHDFLATQNAFRGLSLPETANKGRSGLCFW